jgi:hypothetical protein
LYAIVFGKYFSGLICAYINKWQWKQHILILKYIAKKIKKELKMLNKLLIRKSAIGLILSSLTLFCSQSQSAIIASFDTGVDVDISSTFISNQLYTESFDSDVYIEGNASGNASGSDFGSLALGSNEVGTVSAAANGEVNGIGGLAVGLWNSDGYFSFENNTGSDVIIDVTFDIMWFASIFTSSFGDEAVAYASLYIENLNQDIIFEDVIEFDSLIEGPGTFDFSESFSFSLSITLAAGEYEEYYLAVDTGGFAENVPEPIGLLLSGIVLLFALSKRKLIV